MKAKIPEAKGIKGVVCWEIAEIIRGMAGECSIRDEFKKLPKEIQDAATKIEARDWLILSIDFYTEANKVAEKIWQLLFEE